jgi:hypothetical protein
MSLHGKTRGEDMYKSFYRSLLEINFPNRKRESVITVSALDMISENDGLIWLCGEAAGYPYIFSHYCVVLQHVAWREVIDFQNVVIVVKKL